MGILIWLGAFFQLRHWAIHFVYVQAFVYLFGSIWACQNAPKQPEESFFLLFWIFSSTRMGLSIFLGAYFQAKTLEQTSCPNEPKKGTQRPASKQNVWPNVLV
jgi:hypothetical protein